MMKLTLGMATAEDFDGVRMTVQAGKINAAEAGVSLDQIIVVNNRPGSRHGTDTADFMRKVGPEALHIPFKEYESTAVRDQVFRHSRNEWTICVDSHVILYPSFFRSLQKFAEASPDSIDILHGPMILDDLKSMHSEWKPRWRAEMWGIWFDNPATNDPEGEPYEDWGCGLGAFACRTKAWPGFNPLFRGFGGEEGYIHEKFRRRGGRSLCVPGMRWWHRFGQAVMEGQPDRPVTASKANKIRNYILGHLELGLPLDDMYKHFVTDLRAKTHRQFLQMVDLALADSVSTGVVGAGTSPVWSTPPEKQMVRRIEVC